MSKATLSAELEAELAAIRRDPLDAVGFGEKAFLPYELRKGDGLVRSRDAAVTTRLAAEAGDTTNDRDPQDATYVGYTVLPPSDVERSTLLAQAQAFVIAD